MTRIAVISDIHGNAVALDAALADIERAGVDQIVCLGDAIQGGARFAGKGLQIDLGRVILDDADALMFAKLAADRASSRRRPEKRGNVAGEQFEIECVAPVRRDDRDIDALLFEPDTERIDGGRIEPDPAGPSNGLVQVDKADQAGRDETG